MLNIDQISVRYDTRPVLEAFSVTIHKGSFIGLVGPNGAGKSTFFLAASGQLKPADGQITFDNRDIYLENIWHKSQVGYVHETPFLYPGLTVDEFLNFIGGVKRVPVAQLQNAIAELVDTMMLSEHQYKLNSELSMGMRKKVAIAAALLGPPRILFLDEALNGIDFESAFRIKERLRSFVKNGGTVLLSTHVLEVVEKLCDRYLLLNDGQLLADLQAAEIQAHKKKTNDIEQFLLEMLRGKSKSDNLS